jgi:putative mRNA 3-end processing factor
MMNLDYAIPFSDHCDHSELLEVVKKCNPSKIYTFHGFDKEFANNLVNMGYDAE